MTTEALRLDCVDTPKPDRPSPGTLSRIAADGKRSYFAMLGEIARLGLGAGRLSLDEYLELELFDNAVHKDTDKKAFVGLKAQRKIWFRANYRVDLFALANHKIASAILFAAHGLPILPTLAIFHEQVGRESARLLRSEGELRTFLRTSAHYPLFGKPIEGNQSIGSASLKCYDASRDCLITSDGTDNRPREFHILREVARRIGLSVPSTHQSSCCGAGNVRRPPGYGAPVDHRDEWQAADFARLLENPGGNACGR